MFEPLHVSRKPHLKKKICHSHAPLRHLPAVSGIHLPNRDFNCRGSRLRDPILEGQGSCLTPPGSEFTKAPTLEFPPQPHANIGCICSPPRQYIHTYIHPYHTIPYHTIYSSIHTLVHSYIYTFIHSYSHAVIQSYIHTFIHSYRQSYIHAQTRTHKPTLAPSCTYTCRCTYVYKYTYTQT